MHIFLFNLGMASMFQLHIFIIWNKQHCEEHKGTANRADKLLQWSLNSIGKWNLETKQKCTKKYIRHAFRETYQDGSAHFHKNPYYHNATRMAAYQFLKLFGIWTLWNCWSQQNVKLMLSQYPQYAQHPPHFTLKLCNYGTGNSLF